MKVLHVIPSVSPLRGGPSKAVIEMVAALIAQGVDAEIATTNDHGESELNVPLDVLSEYRGVPVRFFQRFSPAIRPLREFAYSKSFHRWIKKHISTYDVIHVHALFSFTSSYTMRTARKARVPYIVRPIGQLETWSLSQSWWKKKLFLTLFERANLLGANTIHYTAASEKKQSVTSIDELENSTRSEIIPLGIHPPTRIPNAREQIFERYALDKHKNIFLYLSRIHPKKGLELLIDALKSVDSDSWQLVIAGSGNTDYIDQLKQMTTDLDIRECCHFIGFVEGKTKNLLLQGSDLYVLTSYSENFGIAVLESLAADTPALVSRGVALSSIIESEKLGYVCDANAGSISSTLQRAINEAENIRKSPADYVAQTYSWRSIAKSLHDLYKATKQ